jgi:N-acetylmuramoyl-L-alanine amidase
MRRVPSPNHDARRTEGPPDIVVLHYTEMKDADAAVRWLCNPASKVSAHYLVSAAGEVVAMVDEERRAWHAGVAGWDGTGDVNSRSIGIELDSAGHAPDPPIFPETQVAALVDLLEGIRTRWPVPARNVIAHSDVAPLRKRDPGERFPWRRLAEAGHALFVPPQLRHGAADEAALKAALATCGYAVPAEGTDAATLSAIVTAFHRRFMPDRVGQAADGATVATAEAAAAATEADRATNALRAALSK